MGFSGSRDQIDIGNAFAGQTFGLCHEACKDTLSVNTIREHQQTRSIETWHA
jgi:hypothetical protein